MGKTRKLVKPHTRNLKKTRNKKIYKKNKKTHKRRALAKTNRGGGDGYILLNEDEEYTDEEEDTAADEYNQKNGYLTIGSTTEKSVITNDEPVVTNDEPVVPNDEPSDDIAILIAILKKKYELILPIITRYFEILIIIAYYSNSNASEIEKNVTLNNDVNKHLIYIEALNKKEMDKEINRITNTIENRKLMIKAWNEIKECELVNGKVNYPSCDDPNTENNITKPRSDFNGMFVYYFSNICNILTTKKNAVAYKRIDNDDVIRHEFTYENLIDRDFNQIDDFFKSQNNITYKEAKNHVLEINLIIVKISHLGYMHLPKNNKYYYDGYNDEKKFKKLSKIYIQKSFCRFIYTDRKSVMR